MSKKNSDFIKLPYKLLIYDIETALLLAWVFSLGEQVVRHTQLVECSDMFKILTISYKWYGDKKVYVLKGEDALQEFDKIARTADVIIGKNNFKFDDKRLNTDRMLKGLPPFPEWMFRSDDLESQLRKHFSFPSYSLDSISKYLGFGGKHKMEFDDWVKIDKFKITKQFEETVGLQRSPIILNSFTSVLFNSDYNTIIRDGEIALNKMGNYNKKDVSDTEAILQKVLPYIKLKHNAATENEGKGCVTCGSLNVLPDKIISRGQVKYQEFYCLEHKGYAGRATVRYDRNRNKKFGKMQ